MLQQFGGIWTSKKLALLEDYLNFYTKALQNQTFMLHYIDAFAGSGSHQPSEQANQQPLIPIENLRASVEVALSIDRPFDQYHFNDINSEFVAELEQLKAEHSDKKIAVYSQDANTFIPEFCRRLKGSDRAVVLLDPFSTQLDWNTLIPIARSGKIDLWLLFPISVILRMTPKQGEKIKSE